MRCCCAKHAPCTSLEPVSLAWRALDARAARIAKVLSSIFDMHVSLRYCATARRGICQPRHSRRVRSVCAARTVVTRSGFSSSFAGLGERAPSVHRVRSAVAAGGEPAVARRAREGSAQRPVAPHRTHLSPPGRTETRRRSGRAARTAATRRQQAAHEGGRNTPAPAQPQAAVSPFRRCWSSGPSSCPGPRPRSRSGGCTAQREGVAASDAQAGKGHGVGSSVACRVGSGNTRADAQHAARTASRRVARAAPERRSAT